ncbi:hypothetical protein Taro_012275 [Colocasia esculenta]|uniref:Uncharacterized protein n=1 Tax=Colocasia esculenta TaxID=4460 RepID=A0A843UD35_COLES|nr:hypothetical protein [Colocasia esculenta]
MLYLGKGFGSEEIISRFREEKERICEGLIRRLEGFTSDLLRLGDSPKGGGALLTPGNQLVKRACRIKAKIITSLAWPRRASSPKFDLQTFLVRQAMASRGRRSTQAQEDEQRGEERGEQQAPAPKGPTVLLPPPPVDYGVFMQGLVQEMQTQAQTQATLQAQLQAHAQAPAPIPQEHGHGGPFILERFKRMASPPFKGGRVSPFWQRAG